eukprot:CAMPEP_0173200310 /NCGR_PEP_ID=MMETSP1141-20130122/17720_1 /TAXON_ID=483371 /ORGANISM="non described non described, Strain CCMP2298" /LENGTH=181 /DNA_ID=CAMNT_0014125297 /DNA_START=881 /DNA_END=1427 /DNA_ORIENTATION=-
MSLPQRRAGDYMRHPRYCCGVGGVQHGELDGQAVHEVRAPLSVLHKVPPRNPLLEVVMPEGGGGVGVGGGVGEEGGHVGQHAGATFCPSANHDVPLWVPVPVQFPVPYESVPVPAVLQPTQSCNHTPAKGTPALYSLSTVEDTLAVPPSNPTTAPSCDHIGRGPWRPVISPVITSTASSSV